MKKLLITLLLISPFSFADWGDVYYCQMTNFGGITFEGKKENYKPEKFQFKLDKTKNAMVFGKAGYFANSETNIEWSEAMSIETWLAKGAYDLTYFKEGKFQFVTVGILGSISISADCDKF
tara:strand:- start:136 stop:498 length:363 start_codon:yes stop_codon:yes gene_type:complete